MLNVKQANTFKQWSTVFSIEINIDTKCLQLFLHCWEHSKSLSIFSLNPPDKRKNIEHKEHCSASF